jgi:hypothetical protein
MFATYYHDSDIVTDLLDRGADMEAKSQPKLQNLTASDLRAGSQTSTDTQPSCLQYMAITVTL